MKLVLAEGLVARSNVADRNQLLITDPAGFKINASVIRARWGTFDFGPTLAAWLPIQIV